MTTLRIELRTVSGLNAREHWRDRARRVKAERHAVGWAILVERPAKPVPPCAVTMTRIAPRDLDDGDNLSSSMKAVRDQLAEWIGVNDHDPRVTWAYGQERGKPKEYAVRVEIA
jgi:hypothetical protein